MCTVALLRRDARCKPLRKRVQQGGRISGGGMSSIACAKGSYQTPGIWLTHSKTRWTGISLMWSLALVLIILTKSSEHPQSENYLLSSHPTKRVSPSLPSTALYHHQPHLSLPRVGFSISLSFFNSARNRFSHFPKVRFNV